MLVTWAKEMLVVGLFWGRVAYRSRWEVCQCFVYSMKHSDEEQDGGWNMCGTAFMAAAATTPLHQAYRRLKPSWPVMKCMIQLQAGLKAAVGKWRDTSRYTGTSKRLASWDAVLWGSGGRR